MTTLLLRLAGPMQAWGTQSHFEIRDTEREPSKSGVIGLLCAALGRPRDAAIGDLSALRMGVRVDREGAVLVDYQTSGVGGVALASGGQRREAVISRRYYLADADFLVGLEGDAQLLSVLHQALAQPVWQLYLGRKAMVPDVPVRVPDLAELGPGLRPEGLRDALRLYPRFVESARAAGRLSERCRLVVDCQPGEDGETRHDVPLSFETRRFMTRRVVTSFEVVPTKVLED